MRTVAVLALLALPWAGWADDEQEKRAEQEQMRLELREQAEHLKEWRGDVMQSIQKMKRESSDAPPAVAGLLKQKISLHEEMVKAMDTKIAAHNAADFEAIEAAEKKMGELEAKITFGEVDIEEAFMLAELRAQCKELGITKEASGLEEEVKSLFGEIREVRKEIMALHKKEEALHQKRERIFKKLEILLLRREAAELEKSLQE